MAPKSMGNRLIDPVTGRILRAEGKNSDDIVVEDFTKIAQFTPPLLSGEPYLWDSSTGYTFRDKRSRGDNKFRWTCTQYRTHQCQAVAFTKTLNDVELAYYKAWK